MQPVTELQIYESVKSYIKVYPSQCKTITYHEAIKVRKSGYEERNRSRGSAFKRSTGNLVVHEDSIRRTKTRLSDITLANSFDLFVTFTFSPQRVNRFDPDECKKKMSGWLKRQSERNGKFQYLIVPEFHKDGKAIHFHALFKGYKGKIENSGVRQRNREIYNIKSYQLGHSTAVKIDNLEKVSTYIKKYITKDMPTFTGKKRYWCSKGLIRPLKLSNPTVFIHSYLGVRKETDEIFTNNKFDIAITYGSFNLSTIKEIVWQNHKTSKMTGQILMRSLTELTLSGEHLKKAADTQRFKSLISMVGSGTGYQTLDLQYQAF